MKCKNCGAKRENNAMHCAYCDALFSESPSEIRLKQQMETLLKGWSTAFCDVEKQAEDRGVSMMFWGFGLVGLILIALRLWANWGWIALILGAVVGFFVVLFGSIDIGDRLAKRDAENLYRQQIRPQVEAYLASEQVERWQLIEVAQETLGRRRKLRQFLLADGESFN